MGAFQAFASGLAKQGADVAEGQIAAQNTAYTHQQDAVKNNQFQQQLAQQYQLAQQQHDQFRQSLIQAGWKDQGTTLDPNSGSYIRTMYNDATGETRRLPVTGVPPDSPQGTMAYMKQLQAMTDDKGQPLFTPMQVKQIAFKMPNLYRQGPAGIMDEFNDQASDLFDKGITKATGPNGKSIDLSTAAGRQQYAQAQFDLVEGKGGYYHYGAGNLGLGTQRDMTGFTPGEKREFDSATAGLKLQQQMLETSLRAEMVGAITPDQQMAVAAKYQPGLMQVDSQINQIYMGIKLRRFPNFNPQSLLSPAPFGAQPPSTAPPANLLKLGQVTTFKNGQKWTLGPAGKPIQLDQNNQPIAAAGAQ